MIAIAETEVEIDTTTEIAVAGGTSEGPDLDPETADEEGRPLRSNPFSYMNDMSG